VSAPVLEVRGLVKRFGAKVALDGVDLALGAGEIGVVLGPTGAGKTTLLRTLAGVQQPTHGRVAFRSGTEPRPGVDVALCPQEPERVLFRDTVEGEVRATLRARGTTDAPAPWLERLGVVELAARHPRDVSAGQRLLVATAAIAATGAPVLLLDEPTRGLDPESKDRLVRFLRSHTADGGAAAIATHDVELAAAAATRVVMLAGGEVIADGDPASVLGDSHVFAPQMTRVFGPGWLTPEQVAEAMA
jgi:ABC-type multidrug transport system ATPase subunit